jgi:hypothetical protein
LSLGFVFDIILGTCSVEDFNCWTVKKRHFEFEWLYGDCPTIRTKKIEVNLKEPYIPSSKELSEINKHINRRLGDLLKATLSTYSEYKELVR